jgi:hypothetical protein
MFVPVSIPLQAIKGNTHSAAPGLFARPALDGSRPAVCAENLNPNVLMMKPAKDRV